MLLLKYCGTDYRWINKSALFTVISKYLKYRNFNIFVKVAILDNLNTPDYNNDNNHDYLYHYHYYYYIIIIIIIDYNIIINIITIIIIINIIKINIFCYSFITIFKLLLLLLSLITSTEYFQTKIKHILDNTIIYNMAILATLTI